MASSSPDSGNHSKCLIESWDAAGTSHLSVFIIPGNASDLIEMGLQSDSILLRGEAELKPEKNPEQDPACVLGVMTVDAVTAVDVPGGSLSSESETLRGTSWKN